MPKRKTAWLSVALRCFWQATVQGERWISDNAGKKDLKMQHACRECWFIDIYHTEEKIHWTSVYSQLCQYSMATQTFEWIENWHLNSNDHVQTFNQWKRIVKTVRKSRPPSRRSLEISFKTASTTSDGNLFHGSITETCEEPCNTFGWKFGVRTAWISKNAEVCPKHRQNWVWIFLLREHQ